MKAVPEFPKKRPIELEDKALFDRLFKKYPPVISEFTFTNLFAWRHAYQFSVSTFGDFLLVVSLKKDILQVFDPLGPQEKKGAVIRRIFSLRSEKPIRFVRLPEATAALFKGSGDFQAEEDRDNSDYLYLTKDLINLKGRDFDGKRNFIKRFKDENLFMYKRLTGETVGECLSFEEEWCLAKDCQHTEGLAKERQAMQEMLENLGYLGIAGGMIEVEGKVEAVSLGEALSPETFVVHIEKANGGLIGIYQAINQLFCREEAAAYKYVNREQDLGVLGLRKAKESYHPCRMVKKYSLVYSP